MTDSQNDIGAPRQVQGELMMRGDTREDVYNEVIYGLGVLLSTYQSMRSEEYAKGIEVALSYVTAMLEAEA